MYLDDPSSRCSRRGCRERARWRPFVYVPIARLVPEDEPGVMSWAGHAAEQGFVVVPLPMVVCAKHKLPRRVEEQIAQSRRFRKLLAESLAARGPDWTVRMDRSWIVHERIEDERAWR